MASAFFSKALEDSLNKFYQSRLTVGHYATSTPCFRCGVTLLGVETSLNHSPFDIEIRSLFIYQYMIQMGRGDEDLPPDTA